MTHINHLQNARKKQQLLRDRVASLVHGYATGLLIYGPGGIGKSFAVDDELTLQGVSFQRINSHITPMALFYALRQHRDEIVIFEDCESLLRSTISLGILRAATFPSGRDRLGNPIRTVDYYHGHQPESFQFNGRIVMLMNRGLAAMPEADALATRISCIEFELSNAEVAALMRDTASCGQTVAGQRLEFGECQMVVEFLIARATATGRRLNLRMMTHALSDYVQHDANQSGLSWQDLVTSYVDQQPSILDQVSLPSTRKQRHQQELDLARSLVGVDNEERLATWEEKTGRSRSTFYRRLDELAAIDAHAFA